MKLLLTIFATIVLLVKMELIGYAARLAAETTLSRADLRAAGIQLVVHAAGGLLVLLVPAVLSVYKPRGMTRYGWRKQHEQRALSQPQMQRDRYNRQYPRSPATTRPPHQMVHKLAIELTHAKISSKSRPTVVPE